MDIYILNENLQRIGIVDGFNSLIWANRYKELGDCELYIRATSEALDMLKIGRYLSREDDGMICRIDKIDLKTDAENGNYLTVYGTDVKVLLDQRIVWNTSTCNGNVLAFVNRLITENFISPTDAARKMELPNGTTLITLGTQGTFDERTSEQVSYRNIGEKIREYCETYGWGYRMTLNGGQLKFEIIRGTDRTVLVKFSDEFENLISTDYSEDHTNLANVALVAGQGEGSDRVRRETGTASSTDRYEIYVDAKDISKEITFGELKSIYPSGRVQQTPAGYYLYMADSVYFLILEDYQLEELYAEYPEGEEVTIDGQTYFYAEDVRIATVPSAQPEDSDTVVLWDVIYSIYLITRGHEKTAEYGAVTSFEGQVEPNTTFVYKRDYFLGDLITVENQFGITTSARIVEVVEVEDDNGYRIEPKFEYMEA